MRVDCKFYESRTYPSGDAVRMCRLDLAPEAPWRCPADCPRYERKLIDGGWVPGTLAATPPPPPPPNLDEESVRLLDSAEDIINAVGPDIVAEVAEHRARQQRQETSSRRWWWPFGGRA